ncbi:hypothetical protein AAFN85_27215 [Mucilaginibacter sp. CAU 1740]|uniref:hypothetical protein n=1 Tax=Mucilaginibacter sp. CAU 1740 TaxID=3140365 RepID=UPI00325BE6E5
MRGDEHYVPWENYPKFLLFNEIRDPYRALRDAFWGEEPEGNKRLLEQLKTFALSDIHYQGGKEGPAKMVQAVNEWVRMIEICFILWLDRKTPDDWDKAEIVEGSELRFAKHTWKYFPDDLSFYEERNPYIVFRRIFSYISLQDLRDYFDYWLYAALSNKALTVEEFEGNMPQLFDDLLKLHSAAYMVEQLAIGAVWETLTTNNGHHLSYTKEGRKVITIMEDTENYNLFDWKLPRALKRKNRLEREFKFGEMAEALVKEFPFIKHVCHLGAIPHADRIYLLILVDDKVVMTEDEVSDKIQSDRLGKTFIVPIVYKVKDALDEIKTNPRFWEWVVYAGTVLYTDQDLLIPNPEYVTVEMHKSVLERSWKNAHKECRSLLKRIETHFNKEEYKSALSFMIKAIETVQQCAIELKLGYNRQDGKFAKLQQIISLFTDDYQYILYKDTDDDTEFVFYNLFDKGYPKAKTKNFKADKSILETAVKKIEQYLSRTEKLYTQQIAFLEYSLGKFS